MTVSVLVIALMIIGSLMAIISFYYIFVDILTDKRRKVEKVYQRNKKNRKKTMDSLTVINIVWEQSREFFNLHYNIYCLFVVLRFFYFWFFKKKQSFDTQINWLIFRVNLNTLR